MSWRAVYFAENSLLSRHLASYSILAIHFRSLKKTRNVHLIRDQSSCLCMQWCFFLKLHILFFFYINNPGPQCVKAITKLIASGWKTQYYSTPCTVYLCSSKGLLIKTWIALTLSPKAHWKCRFYGKPLQEESLLKYFVRHFLFLHKYFAKIFSSKKSIFCSTSSKG
jgi:hypothetical protein